MTNEDGTKGEKVRITWFCDTILDPLMERSGSGTSDFLRRVAQGRQTSYIALSHATGEVLERVINANPQRLSQLAEAAWEAMEATAEVYKECDPADVSGADWHNELNGMMLERELKSLVGLVLHQELDNHFKWVDMTDAQKQELFTKIGEMVQMLAADKALSGKEELLSMFLPSGKRAGPSF